MCRPHLLILWLTLQIAHKTNFQNLQMRAKQSRMGMQTCKFVVVVVVVVALKYQSFAVQHMVGDDSHWTIPPNNDFYSNWSSSQLFQPGDTLLFEFDAVFYNVMQVSKREYDDCTANQPYQAFIDDGPVTIPLREPGVFYYICSVLNYCSLGQKLNVAVQPPKSSPSPVPENSLGGS